MLYFEITYEQQPYEPLSKMFFSDFIFGLTPKQGIFSDK